MIKGIAIQALKDVLTGKTRINASTSKLTASTTVPVRLIRSKRLDAKYSELAIRGKE